eukprot:11214116-Alexandrium_andersonii.AAC.1
MHECTHVPFRSWCTRRVRGRLPNAPHSARVGGRHDAPEVAMVYCFLSKDTDSQNLTVLVFKDRDSRAILAHPVLCKGRLRSDTIEQAAGS